MKHPVGRITTILVHKNKDLPKGLLRKIIREDLKMNLDDFIEISVKNRLSFIRNHGELQSSD